MGSRTLGILEELLHRKVPYRINIAKWRKDIFFSMGSLAPRQKPKWAPGLTGVSL